MSQCVRSEREKNTRTITQIGETEYLLERKSNWAKFGCEIDDGFLTFANLEGGPFLHVGDNFLGKGRIARLQNITNEKTEYITIKITLSKKE